MWKSPPFEAVETGGRRLVGRVVRVEEVGPQLRERMYLLLCEHFCNTSPERFAADLAEKEWVVLLTDEEGALRGFSTLMRLEGEIAGEPYLAFFSGDTIIHRDFWGETVLPRLWGRHIFTQAGQVPDRRVWWFLISSGYKTYRFLPVFFREFFPRSCGATPPEVKGLQDVLARRKFPREYDPRCGVVRPSHPAPLREGVAEITPERLRDRHVAFFAEANPGWRQGDELVCLAEIHRANLTAAGMRMLREGR